MGPIIDKLTTIKGQLFWEGHKNVTRTIAQVFQAFSEKLNFSRIGRFGITILHFCDSFSHCMGNFFGKLLHTFELKQRKIAHILHSQKQESFFTTSKT